jgi:hypothetical protein
MKKTIRVQALDGKPNETLEMPDRFRLEVVYFMTPEDAPQGNSLGGAEYWIEPDNVEKWLEDGCFSVVSPLDAESVAEIELSEEHERWLEWLRKNQITRVRILKD